VCELFAEMKASKVQGNEKVIFVGSLPDMPTETRFLSGVDAATLGEIPHFENTL
jgi:hypothetical protein